MVDLPVSPARAGWWVALVAVPLALAGVALAWPGAPGEPAVAAPVATGTAPTAPAPTATAVGPTAAARQRTGAGLESALTATPLTFGADSAALSDTARAGVARVVAVLRADPAVPVSVVGYCADTPGPPVVAQRLSEQRAAVVADALVAAGIGRERLTTVGRGDAAPLATTAASRRVEIQVS